VRENERVRKKTKMSVSSNNTIWSRGGGCVVVRENQRKEERITG